MRSSILNALAFTGAVQAVCPYMDGNYVSKRDENSTSSSETFFSQFELDDANSVMTSDVGGPIDDQTTLKAGVRGPALLEDFIFRQKIQHFDHERVPERAVHARGTGAHGTFTSYADWSNITAASFLGAAGKQTDMFVRFSTVAGSRGSAETARDVHGFATRWYTDEGNFDIVGNNMPVFFIQDAIQFPDLIHAVKPKQDREIPQAATAHDSAWDFFSQQPSSLHTLFWAMAGYGIPRSFRHMPGFGIHTYRFVTNDGDSKLVKFHWKTLQGKASLVWEEAQKVSGTNPDFHRQDLWEAIESGNYPEWELGVQIMEEGDELKYGFDLLDPTKIVPVEYVPITPIGKMQLNRNPTNYFAETEQVMFQPGHIVRGIDFTEDPLLQGRIFSYLDTQLNRHNGPNFEQLPINRPRVPIHNNNRDGAGQHYIPVNPAAYSPNTLNGDSPQRANQTVNNGFFTAPKRTASGALERAVSDTFHDVWSQPALFYNSLTETEQQFLINAMRFETSQLESDVVKQNVIIQLNRVNHDLAQRVAIALNIPCPEADSTYYTTNKTADISIMNETLPTIATLKVGILTSVYDNSSLETANSLAAAFTAAGATPKIVAEYLATNVSVTYSAADATAFDGIVVVGGVEKLFLSNSSSTLYPAARPMEILQSGYRFGKPVGSYAGADEAFTLSQINTTPGVYLSNATSASSFVEEFTPGLKIFKFADRFALDH